MQQSSTHIMCESATYESDKTTLSGLSQELLTGFQGFLATYTAHTQTSQGSEQDKLLAEFGRFRVWTEQTGAALQGRDSLDDNLHNDPQLRNSIVEVLQQITELLQLGPSEEVLTSDSEYSEGDAGISNEGSAHPRPKVTRVSLLISHIREQIGLLYHYSVILRSPRLGGRYLHSKSDKEESTIPPYELSHVHQKLVQWNRGANEHVQMAPKTEVHADIPESLLTLDEKLPLRLAAANDRRRAQLRYWFRHPWNTEEQSKEDFVPVIDTAHEITRLPAPSEGPSQGTLPTVHTFSSVARSDIFEEIPEVRPERTEYAGSEGDGYDGTSRVPNVPVESKNATTFECPYCRTALDSSQMQDRNTWKRHVFRDLRPYTCTFSDCSNPDKLYATRRDWAYHEMQMHRRLWSCTLCPYKSTVRQDFAAHLLESHERECQRSQIPLLLEINHGPMEESAPQKCIFCHKQTSLRRLMNHMAGHLEILALFALHAATDDTTEEFSSAELSPLDSEGDDIWQDAEPIPSEEAVDISKTEFTCGQCDRTFDQVHKLKYFTGFPKQELNKANLSL
ncbi:hypothetical protein PG984_004556 [Apiospora sp. TS-2023a]